MGIMLSKQDDKNAELTRRINADLREKMKGTAKMEGPEFVEDFTDPDELFKNIRL